MTNIINKKALLLAAAAACIGGYASAETLPGPNMSHTPQQPNATVTTTRLNGYNGTSGCVRFFANGQHDVQPGRTGNLGTVTINKSYMASVFKGACGGAALRNLWLTPRVGSTTTTQVWVVR